MTLNVYVYTKHIPIVAWLFVSLTGRADEQPSSDTVCTQGAGHGHQRSHAAWTDGGGISVGVPGGKGGGAEFS